jgi:hypothetical protein
MSLPALATPEIPKMSPSPTLSPSPSRDWDCDLRSATAAAAGIFFPFPRETMPLALPAPPAVGATCDATPPVVDVLMIGGKRLPPVEFPVMPKSSIFLNNWWIIKSSNYQRVVDKILISQFDRKADLLMPFAKGHGISIPTSEGQSPELVEPRFLRSSWI